VPDKPQTAGRRDAAAAIDSNEIEPTTGVFPATRDFVREVTKSGLWKVAAGVGAFALGCFIAGITVTKAMAQDARDAGVKAAAEVQRQADQQGEELKRLQADFTAHIQVEAENRVRMEKKVNALLDHFDVKDPAPTPKDGGQ
jgi:hypothetical protein